VNPIGATTSPKLQNPSFSFATPEVLLEIPNVIDVHPDEILFEIPNSTTIDLDDIVELSNSLFDPQAKPPRKKHKFGVDGIGKKPHKKSYDSNKKFQAKWAAKLMATSGIIRIVRCKVCSFIENKDKIVKCKKDTLTKHVDYWIAICDLP